MLTAIISIPLVGMLIFSFFKSKHVSIFRYGTLLTMLCQSGVIIFLFFRVNFFSKQVLFFSEKIPWLHFKLLDQSFLMVDYFLGVDAYNFPFLLLSAFILPLGILLSWSITQNVKMYCMVYLFLSSSIVGAFFSFDIVLFYVFMELSLFPLYFMILKWGHAGRQYAGKQFLIFNFWGALCVWMGILLYVAFVNGDRLPTLEMIFTSQPTPIFQGNFSSLLSFYLLLIGFLIKLGIFPFHIWLPKAHTAAHTVVSILLASLLLKLGGYGLLRIVTILFPHYMKSHGVLLGILAIFTIGYGFFLALRSHSLKMMIAYTSISYMGYALLGCVIGGDLCYQSAIVQMFSHSLTVALSFILLDIFKTRGITTIDDCQRINVKSSFLTIMFGGCFLASIGIPGSVGFLSKGLLILGIIQSMSVGPAVVWLFFLGWVMFLGVYFYATIFQEFFSTSLPHASPTNFQILFGKKMMLWSIILLIIIFGIFPHILYLIID